MINIYCQPTYRSNPRRSAERKRKGFACRARRSVPKKTSEYIIRDGNSLLISGGVAGVSSWMCGEKKRCSAEKNEGREKCLLVYPFLFTVTRVRKAPVVLVPSISPGLWPTQGLDGIINQTHVSTGIQNQHTAICWNDHLHTVTFQGWSFQRDDVKHW